MIWQTRQFFVPSSPSTFQEVVLSLSHFWSQKGCRLLTPYDLPVGAATFHPATFFGALGPQPRSLAYIQPCRRPKDGRYGQNPNRVARHHQFQVVLKPSPDNIQQLALQSFEAAGLKLEEHDIRFIEDNWESPTLGASGLGWEVWCDGMEVLQFTYFQQVAGKTCSPVTVELAYGLERLVLNIQNKENFYDITWSTHAGKEISYGDLFHQAEKDWSTYYFEMSAPTFESFEKELTQGLRIAQQSLFLAAYECCLRANDIFNQLDARGLISVAERAALIGRIRDLAYECGKCPDDLAAFYM